jgi:hypothetical protein
MRRAVKILFILLATSACRAEAVAATVVSNAIGFGVGGMSDYGLSIWEDAAQTDYTAVGIDFDYFGLDVTLTGAFSLLDYGSDWYFLRKGDVISVPSIAAQNYPLIIGLDQSGSATFSPTLDFVNGLEDGIDDFYLGVATGGVPPHPPRSVFGWAKFELVRDSQGHVTGMTLTESAVAYGARGIVAGTTTLVPEPGTAAVVAGVALGACIVFRGRRADASVPRHAA